ncbi:MAG: CDP-diacylglycerol--glycerol-3-phosphate 3-phosphatidyltransferase [Treponemataceae bacterium]|nr:CDP-diacylglycerol--glycerol-3-phosphate 3-phosphatidyltransferase [Treponemataceae bacterium]
MRTADVFTLVRIIAAPVFIFIYFFPEIFGFEGDARHIADIVSVCILIPMILFAEFTDYLDGHYARKHKVVSDFGKLFDPFADVVLHLTVFYCYVKSGYVSSIVLLLFVYREFGQLFLRMIAAKKGVAIAARKGGKFKTVIYIVAGFYSLFLESCARCGLVLPQLQIFMYVGWALYIIGVIASYASFIDYLVHFIPVISKDDE